MRLVITARVWKGGRGLMLLTGGQRTGGHADMFVPAGTAGEGPGPCIWGPSGRW